MSRPPRKKIGLALSEEDRELVQRTAQEGGLGKTDVEEGKTTSVLEPERAVEPKSSEAVAAAPLTANVATLKNSDLRAFVSRKSELAAALERELNKLDPKTRSFVAPTTVLKEFFQENDTLLAELFSKNNILK